MSEIIPKKRYRVEKHPPEGGWGYLIGVGMALPFVSAEKQKYTNHQSQIKIKYFIIDLRIE